MSHNKGLTKEYVGVLQSSVYNLRAEVKFMDRLGPKFAGSPVEIRTNTTAEIDEYLTANATNTSDPLQRHTASRRLKEEQIRNWRENQKTAVLLSKDVNLPINKTNIGRGKTITKEFPPSQSFDKDLEIQDKALQKKYPTAAFARSEAPRKQISETVTMNEKMLRCLPGNKQRKRTFG